ncbi:MAG: SDR family oxidoreductase [Actinobacteria bacterium]|nr:SDR family oxidoreductase [Actinomycetota bacterium]
MSRIVITGGAGFLGSHLCDALLADDHEIVAIDNLVTGRVGNIEHLVGTDNFQFVRQDVTDYLWVPGDVDIVLHFASPASPIDYLEIPIQTLKVGSLGTHNALGLAKDKGARFFLASTSEVYGDPEVHPQTEGYWGNVNPVGVRGCYDEAKRFAEAMTMAYHRVHGVDIRIARIFNTYGPRMRPNDGRVVSTFLTQSLSSKPITVFGDGTQTRSFCYVDDLIEGILALLWSDHAGPVNVGNPAEHTMLELAEVVQQVTHRDSPIDYQGLPVDDPTRRRPDISLLTSISGWTPSTGLVEGLTTTAQWLEAEMD